MNVKIRGHNRAGYWTWQTWQRFPNPLTWLLYWAWHRWVLRYSWYEPDCDRWWRG